MKKSHFDIVGYLLMVFLVIGCRKGDDFIEETIDDVELSGITSKVVFHDQPENEGVANALAKARLIAGVEWMPLNEVPSVYGYNYPIGEQKIGLPYSLAQLVNGYVGLDVSFYTFLTAIHNPFSVMYTENLSFDPYYGFDCAPYYGSVCATSVWYALGFLAPYYTSAIDGISALEKKEALSADSIILCDVLWSKGHVAMVYDIVRDEEGSICAVSVFETTRSDHADSRIITYTYNGFCQRWSRVGWIIYRPKDLSDNTFPERYFFNVETRRAIPLFSYNDDVCTSRGDRVAYAAGENVIINILNTDYGQLELYHNNELFEKRIICSDSEIFQNLPYGDYKARIVNDSQTSDFTYFEVIDVNVSYTLSSNKVTVFFSSKNGTPEFMSLGDDRECPYYCTVFSSSQLEGGCATVARTSPYLKVYFRGKYGRVSNRKKRIY